MSVGNMTVTTAGVHINEVWPTDVLRSQEFSLEIAPRVFRQWRFAGYGDTYRVQRIPNIEAETKAASTDATMRTYTDTEQTVSINVHQCAGFEIEDITKLLSHNDLESEYKRKIGYALGRAVDVNLATLAQSFSQVIGTLGVELTYDNLVRAWRYLADAGVNTASNCTWFMSPAAIAGLLKQEIFISQLYVGNNGRAIEMAKVGQTLGAPVIQTNLTRAPSAGQSESWLQYQNGIALIMAQQPKIVTEYLAKSLANVVVGHQIYGYTEVDRYSEAAGNITATDEWLVLLRTVG